MIKGRIRSQIKFQKDKIAALEDDLKTKKNPTVKEAIEKYIFNERIILSRLYQEAKEYGIDLSDS